MQDDNDDRGNGGEAPHPSAYRNDTPSRNMHSFEVPGDDLDDDGWIQKMGPTFDRLGRPKSPDQYRWVDDHPEFGPLSEDDKSFRNHMAKVFHQSGATQRQVSRYEAAQIKWAKAQREGRAAHLANHWPRTEAELKKNWGSGYSGKLTAANSALRGHLGDKDARALAGLELSDGTKLHQNGAFIRLMAAVGENSSTTVKAAGGSPAQAQQEIKRIQREATKAGLDPTHQNWPHEELDLLYKRAYSTDDLDTTNTLPPGSRSR